MPLLLFVFLVVFIRYRYRLNGATVVSNCYKITIHLDTPRLKHLMMNLSLLGYIRQGDERSESRRFILDVCIVTGNAVVRGATLLSVDGYLCLILVGANT